MNYFISKFLDNLVGFPFEVGIAIVIGILLILAIIILNIIKFLDK